MAEPQVPEEFFALPPQSEWEESPQVVNLDDAPEPTEEQEETSAEPPPEEPKEEGEDKLEDSDPDQSSADDAVVRAARVGGIRELTQLTGDRPRLYQAERINIFGSEASALPRYGPVPATFLRQLKSTFAVPPSHDRLFRALLSSPVQCSVGSPGTGRTTAAIATALLHLERSGRRFEGNVHMLASERGLAAIGEESIPENSVLVLVLRPDGLDPDLAWFSSMEASLRDRGSALIIVTANEPQGSAGLMGTWIVRYEQPDSEEVFRCHLAVRLKPSRIDTLLSASEVWKEVHRCRTPREAATLAAEVLAAVEAGVPDDRLISDREPTEQLGNAHEELIKVSWRKMFLISATVLDGQTAGTVTREAGRLAELHEAGTSDNDPRVEWFTGPMNAWSKCVELVGEPSGDGLGRVVRLSHPRLATRLLEVIWQDHLGERDMLIAWLWPLGAHSHSRVRVRAAQAAAQLACYDFDVVVREVIHEWALDGGFRTRQTCSWALEALALAADGRFAKRVRGLVRSWAGSTNVQLLAAAISAYGTFLGAKDPDEALQRMRRIIGSQAVGRAGRRAKSVNRFEQSLANIVQQALLEVFTSGAEEKVIHELVEWIMTPRWRWRRVAARTLIRLAKRDGQTEGWPLLVELAAAQPQIYTDLVCLWRNALDPRHRDENSWDTLHRWITRADEAADPQLTALMDAVLADIQADEGLARNLAFHQKIWAFRKTCE